jgi:hypothetical protein
VTRAAYLMTPVRSAADDLTRIAKRVRHDLGPAYLAKQPVRAGQPPSIGSGHFRPALRKSGTANMILRQTGNPGVDAFDCSYVLNSLHAAQGASSKVKSITGLEKLELWDHCDYTCPRRENAVVRYKAQGPCIRPYRPVGQLWSVLELRLTTERGAELWR